jgi:hypothetical protein
VNLGGMPAWKVRGGGTGNIVGYGSATKSKEKFSINNYLARIQSDYPN